MIPAGTILDIVYADMAAQVVLTGLRGGAQLSRVAGVELSPGMPAEVLIVNRERTSLDCLLQPVRDSFRRAWREL